MYELQTDTGSLRTYRSNVTGTEIETSLIYTDKEGGKWWGFTNLLQIPHMRKMAANSISQLYGVGFTAEDLKEFVKRVKTDIKSNDAEKYEKVYSHVLQLESIVENNLDPVRQELGLCTVYIMSDTERVDTFTSREALAKMEVWALDLGTQAFFLTWLNDGMIDFTSHYKTLSQTALIMESQ